MKVKHWAPIPEVLAYVEGLIQPGWRVLEIGPGQIPFSKATHFVDRCYRPGADYTMVDVNREKLPFEDDSFDFVYARHVVEDLYNPHLLLEEMSRVGKAGYIETPSPMCELTRGVDGGSDPPYRGYIHHKSIVWTGSPRLIALVEKATIVEHLPLPDRTKELEADPFLWNTYFFWEGRFSVVHYEHDIAFRLHSDYAEVLTHAMNRSIKGAAQTRKLVTGG